MNSSLDIYLEKQRLSLAATTAIEAVMENAELSRSELADKLRVPRSRVTKVLDGETNMTLKTLAQFGLACGVRWLFVGVKADDASAVVTAPAALNLGPGLLWKPLVCVFEPSKQSVLPPLGSPDNAEAEDEREADNQDLSLAA